MAESIRELFEEDKQYMQTLYQPGRDAVSDELNEVELRQRVLRRRTQKDLWGDGFFSSGFQITDSGNPNEITISQGASLIQGEYVQNFSSFNVQNLTTPSGSDRTDIVYARFREVEITDGDDPDILFVDIGDTAFRLKMDVDVFVDEGSTTLPTTTGDLHDSGIHYELIGYLNREDGNDDIDASQIQDSRRIIGVQFLNEDKNLEIVGGGQASWDLGTTEFSFDDDIRVIQPSSLGHAIVLTSESPIVLPNDGSVAYILLDRDATINYNPSILVGDWNSIPNTTSAFPLFYRYNDEIYSVEGTVWGDGQTHPLRQNPLTGQIFDADVAVNADIQGSRLLDASVPNSKLQGPLPDTLTSGAIILWDSGSTCPSGYTKVHYTSANDTYIAIAASAGAAVTTPAGSNTHAHGAHTHTPGSYKITLPLFDLNNIGVGGGITFDAFQSLVGSGTRLQDFAVTGTSGSTTIAPINHEPKHVTLLLCKRD